jgi:hypothetical protein
VGNNTAIFWMLHYQIYKTNKTKQQQKLHTHIFLYACNRPTDKVANIERAIILSGKEDSR